MTWYHVYRLDIITNEILDIAPDDNYHLYRMLTGFAGCLDENDDIFLNDTAVLILRHRSPSPTGRL